MRILSPLLSLLFIYGFLHSETISLIDQNKDQGGWQFDNGREFPGATGELVVGKEKFQDEPVLRLKGNFTKGGNYVQAAVDLPDQPIKQISFWINVPAGADSVPIRLIDGTQQCHQLRLKLNDKGGWQKVTIPVEEYFDKMGTPDALDLTTQYQYWSGAKDARWHQPAKLFVVICGKGLGLEPEIKLSNVTFTPASPKVEIFHTARLDDLVPHGKTAWSYNPGSEFKGAQGSLEVVKAKGAPDGSTLKLSGDFTKGGAYVGMRKEFTFRQVKQLKAVRMMVRSKTTQQFSMRWVDGGKQTHQRKGIKINSDGEWQELTFLPDQFVGAEHWGGANDGVWRGGLKLIEIMLNTRSNPQKVSGLEIANIRADLILEGEILQAAYTDNFETNQDHKTWTGKGKVINNGKSNVLQLSRTLEQITTPTTAASSLFGLSPGFWKVSYHSNPSLHSPDNSYQVQLGLEVMDASGKLIEKLPIGIAHGKVAKQVNHTLQMPVNAHQGRLNLEMKKTYGTYQIDDISITRLNVQPKESSVDRILIKTDVVGNLFYPGNLINFKVEVETIKPLLPSESYLNYRISDYWGTLVESPKTTKLVQLEQRKGKFLYLADVDAPDHLLQTGKFFQIHVEVPQESAKPATEFAGFAMLRESLAKGFSPEKIPFTIRNWDGRVQAYFHLADRLGFRLLGVWGGWSSKPPYKAHLPQVDLVDDLKALWITGTPAASIERNGFTEYSEESLRKGMKNFLEEYAHKGLHKICIGNEPHGKGEKVLENIRAYKAIYESVKAFDENIHVVGTSVEPNEEYFRNGYQNYLDSYDFHIYEHYTKVRQQMKEYRALMKKYDAVKPIHSTELGLNSQGQTRLDVSREMIKKTASFFAEGGEMTSWFTIQYPDPKGKARGQSGDAHCMFDCKYNLYNPRLDAITQYHLINNILDKKFVEEKHYEDGIQSYLFQNNSGASTQILWLDGKRKDILLPLPEDTKHAMLTYIDGSSQMLMCPEEGVHLTISEDPISLTYVDKTKAKLPAKLPKSTLSYSKAKLSLQPGKSSTIQLSGTKRTSDTLEVLAPPLWKSNRTNSSDNTPEQIQIEAYAQTTSRETLIRIQEKSGRNVIGELVIPIQIQP